MGGVVSDSTNMVTALSTSPTAPICRSSGLRPRVQRRRQDLGQEQRERDPEPDEQPGLRRPRGWPAASTARASPAARNCTGTAYASSSRSTIDTLLATSQHHQPEPEQHDHAHAISRVWAYSDSGTPSPETSTSRTKIDAPPCSSESPVDIDAASTAVQNAAELTHGPPTSGRLTKPQQHARRAAPRAAAAPPRSRGTAAGPGTPGSSGRSPPRTAPPSAAAGEALHEHLRPHREAERRHHDHQAVYWNDDVPGAGPGSVRYSGCSAITRSNIGATPPEQTA